MTAAAAVAARQSPSAGDSVQLSDDGDDDCQRGSRREILNVNFETLVLLVSVEIRDSRQRGKRCASYKQIICEPIYVRNRTELSREMRKNHEQMKRKTTREKCACNPWKQTRVGADVAKLGRGGGWLREDFIARSKVEWEASHGGQKQRITGRRYASQPERHERIR